MTETAADHPRSLVVIGSSAGGVEALGVLLSSIRRDFPAPIVLAQHLDPGRPSQLASVLERRTAARVVQVNADTRLENGAIYVVPSNRHVVIRDGTVGVDVDHGDRPRPSVDLLLSSAAQHYGEHLVAVILTGSGSDGAAGAVDVKVAGGTVIIQNPTTAAFPSMPHALPPTAVDHVADLESIGSLLLDVLNGVEQDEPEKVDGNVLSDVLALVSRQASIDFTAYKPATLVRRIGRRMAVNHRASLEAYRDLLEQRPDEVRELVMSLLIKVTEFFRDADAFAYLRKEILPQLLERGRARGRVVRLWSAGCSTGEEAYSLAMLLADELGTELSNWTVKVFATDADESAIAFARRGLYPESVLRNLDEGLKKRYFEADGSGRRVSKLLRQMVIFGQQDLSRGVPFPRIDLVVVRNLLIYFKPELQATVLDLFAFALQHTGGFLFLGKAETARPSNAVFELVNKKWRVHRCLAGPLQPLPRESLSAMSTGLPARAPEPRTERDGGGPVSELALLRRFNDQVLRGIPSGVVVIDRAYRIVAANVAARRLLVVRDATQDQDFLHTVRGLPYAELRAAIDQVFRERTTVTLQELRLDSTTVGEGGHVSLTIAPLNPEANGPEYALLAVTDVSDLVRAKRDLASLRGEQKDLLDGLESGNRRLSELNKELQDANEELQAANEEMMLAQEELQATNEEFEATNEELQSTNEELETNNEELQATNEELETTNEELGARGAELLELNRALTSERLRLSEMVAHAPFHMILLGGPSLAVEALNPHSANVLGSAESLVGRPFAEVCQEPGLAPLVDGVHDAYRHDEIWESAPLPTRGASERPLIFTVVPTHDAAGKVHGVVVFARDARVTD